MLLLFNFLQVSSNCYKCFICITSSEDFRSTKSRRFFELFAGVFFARIMHWNFELLHGISHKFPHFEQRPLSAESKGITWALQDINHFSFIFILFLFYLSLILSHRWNALVASTVLIVVAYLHPFRISYLYFPLILHLLLTKKEYFLRNFPMLLLFVTFLTTKFWS